MKRFLTATLVAAAVAIPQQEAAGIWSQNVCGGSSLNTCVDFQLWESGGYYYFSVTYLSSDFVGGPGEGVITAVGLYDLAGAPLFSFYDQETVSPENWSMSDTQCQVAGEEVGNQLFEACANSDPNRIANGIGLGNTVVFRFRSDEPILAGHFALTSGGGLGARVHIQSYADGECSIKLDNRLALASAVGDGSFSFDCATVPEPSTMGLLGAGLVGVLGMAGLRRRRNGHDVENG